MFRWLWRRFQKTTDFPRTIKQHWYCGEWYIYLDDLRKEGKYSGTSLDPDAPRWAIGKFAFNPFRTGHASRNTSGLIGGLIPAIQIGDEVGLYRQIGNKYRTGFWYDGCSWDDGYQIDLEFVRSIPASEAML